MENLVTVGSAAAPPAVPSCSAGSATPDIAQSLGNLRAEQPKSLKLRAELADAIEARRLADERARAAAGIAARAAAAERDAEAEVARFKAAFDAARADAKRMHAEACIEAFRTGEALPPLLAMPEIDSAALEDLENQRDALEVSAAYLGVEANEASEAASKAAREAHAAAVAVRDHDGARQLMRELLAARDVFWSLVQDASGFFLLDELRPGGPIFTDLKNEISIKMDRDSALRSEHPGEDGWRLVKRYEAMNAAALRKWQDYDRRLTQSSDASFDAAEPTQ